MEEGGQSLGVGVEEGGQSLGVGVEEGGQFQMPGVVVVEDPCLVVVEVVGVGEAMDMSLILSLEEEGEEEAVGG